MITKNEKKVLRMLFAELGKDNSINQIAKACNLAGLKARGNYLFILKLFRNILKSTTSIFPSRLKSTVTITLLSFDLNRLKNTLQSLMSIIPSLFRSIAAVTDKVTFKFLVGDQSESISCFASTCFTLKK